MVKPIEQFITIDGQVFATEDEAKEHETELTAETAARDFVAVLARGSDTSARYLKGLVPYLTTFTLYQNGHIEEAGVMDRHTPAKKVAA